MQDYLPIKIKTHKKCLQLINTRINQTEADIKELRLEAQLHAKSSAGDKYETGRAMADIEIEKHQKSLNNLLQMSTVLNRIDPETHHHEMAPGTFIITDKGFIYIAVGLGKTSVDGQDVLVISYDAPLFGALKNTVIGGKAVFNGRSYKIIDIA